MPLSSLLSEVTTLSLSSLAFASLAVLTSLFLYLFHKPPFPQNAPRLTPETWPILGSLRFFTQRWDFFQRSLAHSNGGNFSFYAGQWRIVGITGDEGRRIFFESKSLGFAEGYAALLGASPTVKENYNVLAEDRKSDEDSRDFGAYFSKRLIAMLKGNQLAKGLPHLLSDAREMLDGLATKSDGITDPFDSVYRMVFKLTMRIVACHEIADDPATLEKTLHLFEKVEATATPVSIMFPWLPTPARVMRVYYGSQLYFIFKRVVDERRREDRREDDALQYLLDQGDSIKDIITFVLGALFAGQLNSGVNAAWVLVYLASQPYWFDRVRDEVNSVADRYAPDKDAPLKDRLMQVPTEAWEGEFPLIDMCLKDCIRLQLSGTAFRKNISGADIPLNKAGTEIIPKDAYVTYAAGEVHYNPEIYENPDEWDPGRYLPERAEDKKRLYGFFGWGVGRHPCLGMRFAKLENNLIVSFFAAYFDDIQVSDKEGNTTTKVPSVNRNNHSARKPDIPVFLKYRTEKA